MFSSLSMPLHTVPKSSNPFRSFSPSIPIYPKSIIILLYCFLMYVKFIFYFNNLLSTISSNTFICCIAILFNFISRSDCIPNCIEFGTIKTWVIEFLPFSQILYRTLQTHPSEYYVLLQLAVCHIRKRYIVFILNIDNGYLCFLYIYFCHNHLWYVISFHVLFAFQFSFCFVFHGSYLCLASIINL